MDRLRNDIRIVLRGLRRSPAFTATAVLLLAVAIGMAGAMWSVLDAVVLRRLPVQDENRIVLPRVLDQNGTDVALTPVEVNELQRDSRTMREVAGLAHGGALWSMPLMDGDRQVHLAGSQVFGNFFDVLGARPLIGRLLQPTDDSTSHVLVLSYGAWQREFGGDPAVLGRLLRQTWQTVPYTIIGVAPPGLDYPLRTDYWVPLPFSQLENVVARLAPSASPEAARAEFLTLMRRLRQKSKASDNIRTADIRTLRTAIVGNVRPALTVLAVAVVFLLAIACVNVGNLLLLRAADRSREFAIRRALGASYGDMVLQLLTESTLLGIAGGTLGLVCGEGVRRAIVAAAPAQLPRLDIVRLAGPPVAATLMVTLLAVCLLGILPAATAVRRRPSLLSHVGTRSGGSTREHQRIRQVLVAAQVALALIMVAGAGLLARTLQRLDSINLGYQPEHLSVLSLSLPGEKIKTDEDIFRMLDAIAPRLDAIQGVNAFTPIIIPPLMGPNFWAYPWQAEWQSVEQARTSSPVAIDVGGSGYFRTFGIPILRGRGFLDSDRETAPHVVVISQSVARRYWPNQDPIGKRLRAVLPDSEPWWTVVGVAGDTHFRTLRQSTPMVYLPWRQWTWQGVIAIRTTAPLSALVPTIRRAVSEAEPGAMVWTARTMDDYLAEPLAQPRLNARLMAAFGFAALALAAVGLFGIMASAVGEQRHDIGVRMALGATPARMRREVLRRALGVCAAGAVAGLALAFAMSRLVQSLLFDISPADPVALLGACGVLLIVAFVAAYLPAHHASRIDPARALQSD